MISLLILLIAYLKFGSLVVYLETTHIRKALERCGAEDPVKAQVEQVLEDYVTACMEEGFSVSQWKAAGETFQESPAVTVLAILVARENLKSLQGLSSKERESSREVLGRLAQGISSGKISAEDYHDLLRQSRSVPESPLEGKHKVRSFPRSAEEVRHVTQETGDLITRRQIGEESFLLNELPRLIRRDLWKSLAAGRMASRQDRGLEPPAR